MRFSFKIPSIFFWICILFLSLVLANPQPCSKPNTTELSYSSDGRGLDRIYHALTTCPNITSLELDFELGGCTPSGDPWQFQFVEGDRFPALKKLSLYETLAKVFWSVPMLIYSKFEV